MLIITENKQSFVDNNRVSFEEILSTQLEESGVGLIRLIVDGIYVGDFRRLYLSSTDFGIVVKNIELGKSLTTKYGRCIVVDMGMKSPDKELFIDTSFRLSKCTDMVKVLLNKEYNDKSYLSRYKEGGINI